MPDTPDRDPAPAVTRALRVLTALADSGGAPMTLSELARTVGIAKSSAANLCAALEEGAMIEREARGYRLGRRTAELGGAFALQFNQVREFFAVCAASEVLRGEVVQIAMLDGAEALYLARHEGRTPHRLGTPLGSRLPAAQSATGRALLMGLDDCQIAELLPPEAFTPVTAHSVTALADLTAVLEAARDRGYAVDENSSFVGLTGVAVPLAPWNPSDPPLAMGAALPSATASPDRVREVGDALRRAAALLTNPLAARA
ncbi:IclR family transcriptional regulator [Microbacterium oryzae]|uniref:IclR family transcriptional regulator n=1 Tax=Microbacterium oryzae TaxID=743009 RepID=UPI0025B0861E|nr:IclR family transcriptional regulator [Microbacterium oryzae]MDN3311511.1 IclR family transcriptional regulator [Microbacterium oryzae]